MNPTSTSLCTPPRLLVDGSSFYPEILDTLKQATKSILIENYLVEDGELWGSVSETLLEAADAGVKVFCIFDAFGSLGLHNDFDRLSLHPNISIKLFNPIHIGLGFHNLRRTHVKLFIVDEKIAYTGGAGITDSFYQPSRALSPWSEVMVKVEDQSIPELCSIFTWKFNAVGNKPRSLFIPLKGPNYIFQKRMVGWLYAHHFSTHWIKRAFYKKLSSANRRIWINSAYFFPTRKTIRFLVKKAQQGVDVRLLLPGVTDVVFMKYLARGRYKKLLAAGVTIHELNDRFLHSKVILIDDWATLGSFNLDVFSFRFNHELNFASTDSCFVSDIEGFFLSKLQSAIEIKPHEWTNRQLLSKLLERITYRVAHFFVKLIK
ncbi:phospholipase D-like domain-containing protein [Litoribrevibacter albus]|uniref:Cardiolipin synthase B n=1 Tax=Litoribrevibacter albus TaxID=1473156 RepID=A0AA37SBS6_9GAMM|nr:phosphatidylserine/phosphatidylglycerophosphate/cardiolipin synthase family protein [Litoribrevibacter albus]GLQ31898.1 cardiolipin synthase B [Litoribrevibacter albus]